MPTEIAPFTGEHLDAAAELLAARHRADLTRQPELSPRFSEATAAREPLLGILDTEGTRGVVALREGRVVGYLLGTAQLPSPTSGRALAVAPRSVSIGYAGHAVEPQDGEEIYRALYAALSEYWVDAGYFTHYAGVPATDRQALDAWFSLGFGQEFGFGVRRTTPLAAERPDPNIDIRLAGPQDIDLVMRMVDANGAYHARAPMFSPYLPETFLDHRQYHVDLLADPANAVWVAYRDGEPLGLQTFVPSMEGPSNPERCIHLQNGYTEPAARGSGVASILLAKSLAWAHQAGYEYCTVGWLTTNLLSSRFWQRSGFRPCFYRLCRSVDQRIAWARPTLN
jgi:GNAT superfamily N-acetyltransferase